VSGAVSPSGKLCVSWPATLGQMPVFYGMRPTGRPHDPSNGWSTGFLDAPYAPRWSFGEGLSYARFARSNLRLDNDEINGDGAVTVSLDIRNDGDRAGAETLFLFIRDPVARVTRPVLELKDFTRVQLAPGESRAVHFVLRAKDFSYRDETLKPRLDDGIIHIYVGASARLGDLDRIDVRVVNSAASLG
jgi:beta-glucosidase